MGGVESCDAAITLLQQILQDSTSAGSTACSVQASLALIDALHTQQAGGSSQKDNRPLLSRLLGIASDARAAVHEALQDCSPADMPDSTALPLRRLLASLTSKQAQLHAAYATAEAACAGDDAEERRPDFPTLGDADASVVAAFLDSTHDAALAETTEKVVAPLSHQQKALLVSQETQTLTTSSADLAASHLASCEVHALRWHSATRNTTEAWWPASGPATERERSTSDDACYVTGSADKQTASGSLPAEATSDDAQPSQDQSAAVKHSFDAAVGEGSAALRHAILAHDWHTARRAAMAMVQLHGERQPAKAAAALAVLQACKAAAAGWQRSQSIAAPRSRERLLDKALMEQSRAGLPSAEQPPVTAYARAVKSIADYLQAADAADQVSAALAGLPHAVRVLMLEVDQASGELLVAMVAKAEEGAQAVEQPSVRVQRASIDNKQLQALTARVQAFQALLAAAQGTSSTTTSHGDAGPDSLVSEWQAILASMSALLVPVAGVLAAAASTSRPPSTEAAGKGQSKAKSTKGKPAGQAGAKAQVVLCVNGALAALPLEALPALNNAASVSRDISLCALALRASSLGNDASVQLSSAVCQYSAALASDVQAKLLSAHGTSWTASALSHEHQSSTAETTKVLERATAYLYVSTERLPQQVPFSALCATDLAGMRLAVILDTMADADRTAAHELAVAKQRSASAEKPLWQQETLGELLLQRGVRSCMLMRYPDSPAGSIAVCASVLAAAAGGKPIGEAIAAANADRATEVPTAQPWLKYSVVLFGLPHVAVESGAKPGKKK